MSQSDFIYPNVSTLGPRPISNDRITESQTGKNSADRAEFNRLLDQAISKPAAEKVDDLKVSKDLSQIREPVKFSSHAYQRMNERGIRLNPEQMAKVGDAVDRAQAKGLEDALVLSDQGAFIVSVKNRTVVTALDKASLGGNVFTNIDGAVIV